MGSTSCLLTNETFQFWKHLAAAGLIEGTYTGINVTGTQRGINVPVSKLGTADWAYGITAAGLPPTISSVLDNGFYLGSDVGWALNTGTVLTPEDAWNIDSKVDDGKPWSGNVLAYHFGGCEDNSNPSDNNRPYLLSDKTVSCGLAFMDK